MLTLLTIVKPPAPDLREAIEKLIRPEFPAAKWYIWKVVQVGKPHLPVKGVPYWVTMLEIGEDMEVTDIGSGVTECKYPPNLFTQNASISTQTALHFYDIQPEKLSGIQTPTTRTSELSGTTIQDQEISGLTDSEPLEIG